MRYLWLLLILCCAFFVLNSVTQFRNSFSFLAGGNTIGQADAHGPRPAHIRWATASAMPVKGGPSSGTGLHTAASPASLSASAESLTDQTAAQDAIGTVGVDVPKTVLINPTHTEPAVAGIEPAAVVAPAAATAVAPVDAVAASLPDAVAASDVDVFSRDGAEDISMSADYLDLDLAAVPDVT